MFSSYSRLWSWIDYDDKEAERKNTPWPLVVILVVIIIVALFSL